MSMQIGPRERKSSSARVLKAYRRHRLTCLILECRLSKSCRKCVAALPHVRFPPLSADILQMQDPAACFFGFVCMSRQTEICGAVEIRTCHLLQTATCGCSCRRSPLQRRTLHVAGACCLVPASSRSWQACQTTMSTSESDNSASSTPSRDCVRCRVGA